MIAFIYTYVTFYPQIKVKGVRGTTGTSETKGVSWHEASSKWRARMYSKNKQISLGSFNTEALAIAALTAAKADPAAWHAKLEAAKAKKASEKKTKSAAAKKVCS